MTLDVIQQYCYRFSANKIYAALNILSSYLSA